MTSQTIIPPGRHQRPMFIKGLVPRLPERGRIAIGVKGEVMTSARGKQFQPPQKLDHFRVTTLQRGADGNFLLDTAFHAKYGPTPTEIPVRLLYDDPTLNYPTRYACYIGRTLWCTGDGEAATRLTARPEELETGTIAPRDVACTCPRQEAAYQGADRCKMNGALSVLIEGMGGLGGVWRFRTTSYNSIVGILSSMAFLRSVTSGVLANIPLLLRVAPKQATNPTNPAQSVTIYVVSLEFAGEIAELQQYAHQIALDRATTHMSITHIEEEARRVLELPAPDNAVLPGDDGDEVVEEFYPEQVSEPTVVPPRPTREQFVAPQASDEPELSPSETYELAVLTVAGDEAAAQGADAFTTWWNEGATKAYRKELTPRLEAWRVVVQSAEPEPFEIIDMVGNVIQYPRLDHALEAYQDAMIEADRSGEAALTAVWDNNQGFLRRLDEMGDDTKAFGLDYGKMREAAAAREADVPVRSNDAADPPGAVVVAGAAQEAPIPSPTPAATDLLGGVPAADLFIPFVKPFAADYFSRQLLALIDEGPRDNIRLRRIKAENEGGLLMLKKASTALYDEAMAALTAHRGPGGA